MFLAWLMCISFFIGSYYTTMVLFDRLKEKDQSDLANLEIQLKNLNNIKAQPLKQAV